MGSSRAHVWEVYFTTTARLASRIEAELKAAHHLSMPEYNVLLSAQRSGPEGIRLGELARQVVFSPSRLTHTVKRLTERGLVQRLACESDKRGGLISITPAGQSLWREAADLHKRLVRNLALDEMSQEEADTLEAVFTRIAQRLEDPSHGTTKA
ncbi:MarR family transcriptional regulator [Schaalia sp. 19OD2882]|uniref:MarR family winged helix-turn-helix transcriptional regulator n=1 Tax=Schaalia sp. 19OD2882 TaxID=2794089 RepID=UPI001C1E9219|nr:MarR family transcriptional regulator [Schaalia sp. 19OD2882]QWW19781.1 MarR family transcriptional regulator [Schaalia sp. 19OD2882]